MTNGNAHDDDVNNVYEQNSSENNARQLKIVAEAIKGLTKVVFDLTNQAQLQLKTTQKQQESIKLQQETITKLAQGGKRKSRGVSPESSDDDGSDEVHYVNEEVFVNKKTIKKLLSQKHFVPLQDLA